MGQILYRLSIFFYRMLVWVASLFHSKAKKLLEGKKEWPKGLKSLPPKENTRIWFHSASMGEFEQARPVIEQLKIHFPEVSIILTFFSPSGYEVRKNYNLADAVLYLPWDTPKNARDLLNAVKPDIIVFVKYEFWRYFLKEGAKRNIPQILISGIFRPSQLFFKAYGESYRKILDYFEHFFLQNQQSMDLLASIGVTSTTLSGDTRFDRVKDVVDEAEVIAIAAKFKNNEKVFIAGSIWKEDLERIIPVINDPDIELKFILAPHEIDPHEISNWRKELKVNNILYSEANENPALESARVLIIDNIGLLSKLYRYGNYAFVGGAYGPGLHNTLEAVAFGMPVMFGNRNFKKYQEAVDLIDLGVGYALEDSSKLKRIIIDFEKNSTSYSSACAEAKGYIDSKIGATEMIFKYLSEKIKNL